VEIGQTESDSWVRDLEESLSGFPFFMA